MTSTLPRTSLADAAAEAFRDHLAGRPERMRDLVDLVTPVLWSVARSAGLTPEEAEDTVQTAWLTLVRSQASIRDPQTVLAWLLTTVRRDAWRVKRRTRTTAPEPEVVVATDDPAAEAIAHDTNRTLWDHVARLNPRCQALLRVVAHAQTADYAGISAALGMPVGSIGPTRGRCLAALRTSLSADPRWSW
ncbi:RNA polymerase sigma factor [Aestuariimicrobium soli]|uniref:RNA polymerase sigma factor n=1 Tax=Aestuariimicrobium soli TaxID=2035834 RepID=UPI003EBCBFBE